MSRLIDAEALKKTFCAECDHTISCEDCDIDYHFEHLAPTVEAIPIEWLMKWADNYAKNTSEKYKAYVIRVIEAIVDWRKEQNNE